MQIKEQRCPYCGAGLESETGLSTFFCKYCGGKILVDDSDKHNVELRKMEHEETMKQLHNAYDFRTMDHIEKVQAEANSQERFRTQQKRKGGFGRGCLTIILAVVLGFVLLGVVTIVTENNRITRSYSTNQSDAEKLAVHQKEVERLTRIEQSVLEDIANGDYANALVKANTIHYTAPEHFGLGIYGSVSKWDERREEIIKSIYQVSGMGTPTPLPVLSPVYMEGASEKTTWPKGNIAKYIPIPASDNIEISWEKENGFYLEVKDFSKKQFEIYCDMCWDMGFSLRYEKGDKYYRADNSTGYHLSLKYETNKMSVRLEKE